MKKDKTDNAVRQKAVTATWLERKMGKENDGKYHSDLLVEQPTVPFEMITMREAAWHKFRLWVTRRMSWCPLISRLAYTSPVMWTLVFFPNHQAAMKVVPMELDNTLKMATRTFSINPKKIYNCNGNSISMYRHDCLEPLDVDNRSIIAKEYRPEIYKATIESNLHKELLRADDAKSALNLKIIMIIVIVILVMVFVAIAQLAGWIDLKSMMKGSGA